MFKLPLSSMLHIYTSITWFKIVPALHGHSLHAGWVISPDFSLKSTGFFPGKHLIHFLVLKSQDEGFRSK